MAYQVNQDENVSGNFPEFAEIFLFVLLFLAVARKDQ